MKCKGCGYSLWNVPGRTCPECGRGFLPSEFEFRANAVEYCCPACMQQYYGTDQVGLLVPREFDCVRCGAHCTLDQMILRAAPGTDADDVEINKVAWEDKQIGGSIRRWWRMISDGLLRPSRIGQAISQRCDGRKSTWYAVTMSGLIVLPTFIVFVFFFLLTPVFSAVRTRTGSNGFSAVVFEEVAVAGAIALGAIALLLIYLVVFAWQAKVVLRILGEKREWRPIWCAYCYSLGPTVFLGIPCLGPYCGTVPFMLWTSIVTILVLIKGASVTGWKAACAVLLPVVVWFSILGALVVFVFVPAMSNAVNARMNAARVPADGTDPDAAEPIDAANSSDEVVPDAGTLNPRKETPVETP